MNFFSTAERSPKIVNGVFADFRHELLTCVLIVIYTGTSFELFVASGLSERDVEGLEGWLALDKKEALVVSVWACDGSLHVLSVLSS